MRRARARTTPFVYPVVFAFSAGVQFSQVAGDDNRWDPEDRSEVIELSRSLMTAVQTTPVLTAVAVRRRRTEISLIAIPVDATERGSNRRGLSVVLGIASSGNSNQHVQLHDQAFAALVDAVTRQFPGNNLHSAANNLAAALQEDIPPIVSDLLRDEVKILSRCFTFLASGYADASPRTSNPDPPAEIPAAILRQMAWGQLHRSGRDQIGHLLPLASFDSEAPPITLPGSITCHYFSERTVYICQSAALPR